MLDVNSRTWAYIKRHLESEIDDKREQLESVNCTHDRANVLRGQIMEARTLLDLPTADLE